MKKNQNCRRLELAKCGDFQENSVQFIQEKLQALEIQAFLICYFLSDNLAHISEVPAKTSLQEQSSSIISSAATVLLVNTQSRSLFLSLMDGLRLTVHVPIVRFRFSIGAINCVHFRVFSLFFMYIIQLMFNYFTTCVSKKCCHRTSEIPLACLLSGIESPSIYFRKINSYIEQLFSF